MTGTWPSIDRFYDDTEGADVELGYAGLNTFLKGDPVDVRDLDAGDTTPDVAVNGVPYDGAVSNRPGTRYGPQAVRRASAWWAYLSGYKGGLTNVNTRQQVDYSTFDVVDCGDVPVFPMDHERTAQSAFAHVAAASEHAFPVTIGGDHYCTYPAFRGFAATLSPGTASGSDTADGGVDAADSELPTVGLVQIDAHSDTVGRSPTFGAEFHGSSTRLIAESPYSGYDHVSQVGIRGYEAPDFFEFADETGLSVYTTRDVNEQGIEDVVAAAVTDAAAGADAVYVTFDIDSIDPGVAPGTGTPEPAGLSADQALRTMEVLGAHDAVGAVDLMEVSPEYDPTGTTALLGSQLLVTLLERRFAE